MSDRAEDRRVKKALIDVRWRTHGEDGHTIYTDMNTLLVVADGYCPQVARHIVKIHNAALDAKAKEQV